MEKIIITISGPVASGKSSIAHMIMKELSMNSINSTIQDEDLNRSPFGYLDALNAIHERVEVEIVVKQTNKFWGEPSKEELSEMDKNAQEINV